MRFAWPPPPWNNNYLNSSKYITLTQKKKMSIQQRIRTNSNSASRIAEGMCPESRIRNSVSEDRDRLHNIRHTETNREIRINTSRNRNQVPRRDPRTNRKWKLAQERRIYKMRKAWRQTHNRYSKIAKHAKLRYNAVIKPEVLHASEVRKTSSKRTRNHETTKSIGFSSEKSQRKCRT